MTPEERAKDWSRRVGNEHYCGAICQEQFVEAVVMEAVADEREACHDIAIAIDSGRGNEKEIAAAIHSRGKSK